MLLLGHRGARLKAPENTLAAFDQALADGCDGFEFDLRATADRRQVVCHDPRLFGLEVARAVYPELVHRSCAKTGSETAVPTLEDVLAGFAGRAFLDVELKVAGMEEAVISALREHPPQRGFVVSSFLPEVLERLAALDAALPLGYITDRKRALARWRELPIRALIAHRSLVTRELVTEAHAAGKQLFVWAVNDGNEMRRLAEWDVDALISDDAALLGNLFAGR